MSRRTKLCIAALFLGLVAIPVVYVVLSWAPPSPLRFRLLSERLDKQSSTDVKVLEIEVLNTTGLTPVQCGGTLFGTPPGKPSEETISYLYSDAETDGPKYIYPRSSTRYTAVLGGLGYLADQSHLRIPVEDMRIEYAWVSQPKNWVIKARNCLCGLLPPEFEKYVPAPPANIDCAPLETTP